MPRKNEKLVLKIKICLFILSLPAWYFGIKQPVNLSFYQRIIAGGIAFVGLSLGIEATQEFLINRRKNKTPNSPNKLIKRWEKERQLVDYID